MKHLDMLAAVRKAIRRDLPHVSISNRTGTAWGWTGIRGSGPGHEFTRAERNWFKAHNHRVDGSYASWSPDELPHWYKKLCDPTAYAAPLHDYSD